MNSNPLIRRGMFAAILLVGAVCHAQDATTSAHGALSTLNSGETSVANVATGYTGSQFILGAADVIHVNVWKNNELSQTVMIGPDGFVSLPLLGDVHVAGMTANQLAQMLTVKLTSFIVQPQVTVSVVDIRSRQVYVLGQVGKPGGYPLITPMNVLQLIAQAGGLTTYANRKAITILRATQNGTQRISFNYGNVVRGDGKQNIVLEPGDTVVVP
jgi:polysaccharide export outer membrane protein